MSDLLQILLQFGIGFCGVMIGTTITKKQLESENELLRAVAAEMAKDILILKIEKKDLEKKLEALKNDMD